MHPSGRLWFLTYPFNIFMYHSNRYIHLKKIGPHSLISLTKWTVRCTMISKNWRWKIYFKLTQHNHNILLQLIQFLGSITVLHIALKKKQSWVMAWRSCFRSIEHIKTGNNYCNNAWQSWNFRQINFRSFINMRHQKFDE